MIRQSLYKQLPIFKSNLDYPVPYEYTLLQVPRSLRQYFQQIKQRDGNSGIETNRSAAIRQARLLQDSSNQPEYKHKTKIPCKPQAKPHKQQRMRYHKSQKRTISPRSFRFILKLLHNSFSSSALGNPTPAIFLSRWYRFNALFMLRPLSLSGPLLM